MVSVSGPGKSVLSVVGLPFAVLLAFGSAWGQDSEKKSAFTAAAPAEIHKPPTCSVTSNSNSADPRIVRFGERARLDVVIAGGPANGYFPAASGECTSFSNSTAASCLTAALYRSGEHTFTLSVSAAHGDNAEVANHCSTKVFVGCQRYRVWNNTGYPYDFLLYGLDRISCWPGRTREITTPPGALLETGGKLEQYDAETGTGLRCGGPVLRTFPFDAAMGWDSLARGGNGDCQVNFLGPDR